ncbi:MAG TPA: condensation domain-containing protein, partial [Candidatus Saccharimonadales bacterium]|nr:condensation domain-containing protein [Candidatus Saccharimonadales bacterium]
MRLEQEDLSADPDREERARGIVEAEALKPFDLSLGPLIRARVVRLGAEDHLFLLTMHHIVSDGWSMGVLVREIAALYEAYAGGKESPLGELPIQYADFAVWQRERLSGERLERELGYWRERLTPLPPVLELPADRPRPAVQSFRGGMAEVKVAAELAERLKAVSREEGATLFMTLLAAFDALLSGWTGERDVAVGTGVANRTVEELEGLIGFFVNTLVLRVDCGGDPTFRELVGRVREVTLGAYAHQELPFERLVEEVQPERDLGRNPVFQVAFAFQNTPDSGFEAPGLASVGFPFESWTTRFDLELHMWESAGGLLEGRLFCDADRYDDATARRIIERYIAFLAVIGEDPNRRLSRLPIATGREMEEAVALSRGERLPVEPVPAWELFERQAARAPGAAAIEEEDRVVTYGRLREAAIGLSSRLRRLGAGRSSRVAILAGRSAAQVTAALAAVRCGAAYVPLDPANPDPRIRSMLESSGASVVLVAPGLEGRVPGGGRHVLLLDGEPAESPGDPGAPAACSKDELAYVIFTSGSTGEPNGVEVTHGNLANLVAWHREAFGVREEDRAALVAGTGFDASVWELWPCIASGACLSIPDTTTRLDPEALRDWIVARRLTIVFLPTPLAELVLALDWPRDAALRTLLTGGDRLHAVETGRLPFRVVNNYGPTEATVVATSGEADAGASLPMPTIGRPVANAFAYV